MKTGIYSNVIFWMFIISFILIISIFLIYSFLYKYKRQNSLIKISIREKIRSMVTIALFGAIGTSFVITLNYVGSFAVIPTLRIGFQSLIVKISGFFFGPWYGLITALITEIGVVSFVPVYFHWKITLIIVSQGIICGFVKNIKDKKTYRFIQILFLLLFLSFWFLLTLSFSTITLFSGSINLNDELFKNFIQKFPENIETIFLGGKNISWVSTTVFYISILTFICLILFSLFIIFYLIFNKNRENKLKIFIYNIIPILFLTVISEYFVSVGISTNMNQDLLGQSNKSADFLLKTSLIIAPIKLSINTLIIYSIWKTINPILKKRKYYD